MNPHNDLKTMEIILYEYSLCYYRFKLAGFYNGYEIHSEWVSIRDIHNCKFDALEAQYVALAKALGEEPRMYLQSSMDLSNSENLEVLIKMSCCPSVLLCWPEGYDNLDEIVDSKPLEKRIEKLSQQKSNKQII